MENEVSIAGTQEWTIVPGNQESSVSLEVDFNTAGKSPALCSVSQGREAQTECDVLFNQHQQVQINLRPHLHKRLLPLTGQHRDMSFVDKVCYETLSVLSMSIFSWHTNSQHSMLCEITAIFLLAPTNSDELTDGKHVISPLNVLCTCQSNDAAEWNLPSSLDIFWRGWCENFRNICKVIGESVANNFWDVSLTFVLDST